MGKIFGIISVIFWLTIWTFVFSHYDYSIIKFWAENKIGFIVPLLAGIIFALWTFIPRRIGKTKIAILGK